VHEGRKKKTELAQKFSSGGPICDVTNRKLILPSRDDFFFFLLLSRCAPPFPGKSCEPSQCDKIGRNFRLLGDCLPWAGYENDRISPHFQTTFSSVKVLYQY
jgi:hypothetical protein